MEFPYGYPDGKFSYKYNFLQCHRSTYVMLGTCYPIICNSNNILHKLYVIGY